MKKVCILGGGASSLFCALNINENIDVTIFEKNDKIGKKILATGNGRCNLTNLNIDKNSYNQDITNFLKKFNVEQTIAFFKSLGLATYADEMGRVYPISNSATSVLDVLKNAIASKPNIHIVSGKTVKDISKNSDQYVITFEDNSTCNFQNVIVALGNEINLQMFDKLGVQTKKFTPSLCAIKTQKQNKLAGIRLSDVKVSCMLNNYAFEEVGEVLFREDGLSGIVIFNLSSFMARSGSFENYQICIDLLPKISLEELNKMLLERKSAFAKSSISEFLTGIFVKAINLNLFERLNIGADKKVGSLADGQIFELAKTIKNLTFVSTGNLNNNQVCCGGVCLNQLDQTLQCKNHKGLYFIGEAVDIDGVCGGYNLQWAWTSGAIVGQSL
ncbi:MAG: aminoacetone oxidase family FAD-binding enzyme [Clostridiales bacterium]|nr:aminoacetone oxidase family FAD-binding enzyme [Clostridiales bacterium]